MLCVYKHLIKVIYSNIYKFLGNERLEKHGAIGGSDEMKINILPSATVNCDSAASYGQRFMRKAINDQNALVKDET